MQKCIYLNYLLQIVWRQKQKNEHGTWDKKKLTPPPIGICPLFHELKKVFKRVAPSSEPNSTSIWMLVGDIFDPSCSIREVPCSESLPNAWF